MRLNIEINDELMAKVQELSGITDKSILIEKALQLYAAVESQRKLGDLWGKVEFDEEAIK